MTGAKNTLIIAGVFGALAVAIGAFGAHGLKELLVENGRLDTFETAVKYHFYHTLALLALGLLMMRFHSKLFLYAAGFMMLGIVIFSGSLYILCLTNMTFLGAITPLGGLAFICGWLFLSIGVARSL
ncbi:hypothetical protein C900_02198 [Fulvivirga imtechensis AK7]|uniref:DUF423 domain-containing protein n=1 Tax=Fulvivirga imtechensis AK7 TaxID=1237149 RepID=L8JUA7_9BACT|nr:DUF423 domain-containing protein [Fulvivirga imtechensis]ELR71823.1 hypothetical protein C900_02198 [Fulvivirga imtechensis AK7]